MNKCKKCLLYEIAGKEDIYAHVLKTRALLAPKELVSDEKYQERLDTCRECGCYVEIRALKTSAHCPYKKW